MNRDRKYRQWDKRLKKFFYFRLGRNGITINDDTMMSFDSDRMDIQDFTGHKDVGSNDIYEGDIIYDDGQKGEVFWDNDTSSFRVRIDGEVFSDYLCDYCDMQIIGNIYKTPELVFSSSKTYSANEVKKE